MRYTIERIRGRCIQDGDCLLWSGKVYHSGAPAAVERIGGKDYHVPVRRRAYEEYHGVKVGANERITTKCGNPRCLSKKCLECITVSEKNRRTHAKMDAATRMRRNRLLSEAQEAKRKISFEVAQMIRESDKGPYVIAREMGVSGAVASRIKRGVTHKSYQASPWAGLLA